jgi:hypothetical protein
VHLPDRPEPLVIDDDPWRALRDGRVPAEPARLVYAAAHVVMLDTYEDAAPAEAVEAFVDWGATRDFRRHLDAHGFGIAEAMDTAQRFELGWPAARRLIEETGALNLPHGFVAGAGTDHLEQVHDIDDLVDGVVFQIEQIRRHGGVPIVLPMPWLTRTSCAPDDYVEAYGAIVRQAGGPLLIHWLGEMFMPELAGYFPGDSFLRVMDLDPSVVRGVKLSLLDDQLEIRVRRQLLERDQIVLTGDDMHFGELISGCDRTVIRHTSIAGRTVPLGDFSHALLGIFDAIAVPAALALQRLALDDIDGYRRIMSRCETLGRIVFEPPTSDYKAGLALLAWLNGHQGNAMLVNRRDRARSREHLLRVVEHAAAAGAITDASVAGDRLAGWLES